MLLPALQEQGGGAGPHVGAREVSRVQGVFAAAVRMMGEEAKGLFRSYPLPPAAAWGAARHRVSRFELEAVVACLERLACRLKDRISRPDEAHIVPPSQHAS
jgi:hypothetical protein